MWHVLSVSCSLYMYSLHVCRAERPDRQRYHSRKPIARPSKPFSGKGLGPDPPASIGFRASGQQIHVESIYSYTPRRAMMHNQARVISFLSLVISLAQVMARIPQSDFLRMRVPSYHVQTSHHSVSVFPRRC